MSGVEAVAVSCPYCGEPIELLVDPGSAGERYIEDCSVCCRPIEVAIEALDDGTPAVTVRAENEV